MLTTRLAKPGDEKGISEVHVASWRATYAGLIPDGVLAALSVEKRTLMWAGAIRKMREEAGRNVLYVCEDENGIIQGFVAGGAEREPECGYDAELYAIYLQKDHHGKGAGRHLAGALAEWLHLNGYKRMRLWVLQENPSRRFYERIGGKLLAHSKSADFSGKVFTEVAYGWDDIGALALSLRGDGSATTCTPRSSPGGRP